MFKIIIFLILIVAVRAFAVETTPISDIRPLFDFSKIQNSYTPDDKHSMSHGYFNKTKPLPLPPVVKIKIQMILSDQWKSLISDEVRISKVNKKYSFDISRSVNRWPDEFFGPIYKLKLIPSFGEKELYLLRVDIYHAPTSCDWYFIFYDPNSKKCTDEPGFIDHWNCDKYSFEDLLGDGQTELMMDTSGHDGTANRTVRRYFFCGEDLSVKEIFAFVTGDYVLGGCNTETKMVKNDHGILNFSRHRFCKNVDGGPNIDEIKTLTKNVKDFDPQKEEIEFNHY